MDKKAKIEIENEKGEIIFSTPMNAYNGDWIRSSRLDPEKDAEKIEELKSDTNITRISDT